MVNDILRLFLSNPTTIFIFVWLIMGGAAGGIVAWIVPGFSKPQWNILVGAAGGIFGGSLFILYFRSQDWVGSVIVAMLTSLLCLLVQRLLEPKAGRDPMNLIFSQETGYGQSPFSQPMHNGVAEYESLYPANVTQTYDFNSSVSSLYNAPKYNAPNNSQSPEHGPLHYDNEMFGTGVNSLSGTSFFDDGFDVPEEPSLIANERNREFHLFDLMDGADTQAVDIASAGNSTTESRLERNSTAQAEHPDPAIDFQSIFKPKKSNEQSGHSTYTFAAEDPYPSDAEPLSNGMSSHGEYAESGSRWMIEDAETSMLRPGQGGYSFSFEEEASEPHSFDEWLKQKYGFATKENSSRQSGLLAAEGIENEPVKGENRANPEQLTDIHAVATEALLDDLSVSPSIDLPELSHAEGNQPLSPSTDAVSLPDEAASNDLSSTELIANEGIGNEGIGNEGVGNEPIMQDFAEPIVATAEVEMNSSGDDAAVAVEDVLETAVLEAPASKTTDPEKTFPVAAARDEPARDEPARDQPLAAGSVSHELASDIDADMEPDFAYPDDLTAIKGIGEVYAQRLYEMGVFTWAQIAALEPPLLKDWVDAKPSANVKEWPGIAKALATAHDRLEATYDGPIPERFTRINGITKPLEKALYQHGIMTTADLTAAHAQQLAERLAPLGATTAKVQRWIAQAKRL